LTKKEADVYIFLAKHEALKAPEIAKLIKMDRAQVFRILKKLQTKGFVESTLEFPSRYAVVPFERILDSIIKTRREEVVSIEKAKQDLVNYLKKNRSAESSLEKFVVIKGNKKIYSKIKQMIHDTEHQLSAITTVRSLIRAYQFDVFDVAFNHPLKSQIRFRFLTELSEQNLNAVKAVLAQTPKTGFNFKVRNPELGLKLFPRLITRDNKEVLFYTTKGTDKPEVDDVCLWTNSISLVQTFNAVFEDFWHNSTDIQTKIAEIENGKLEPKTYVVSDERATRRRYDKILQSAEKEIIVMTSSEGLNQYKESIPLLETLDNKGVSVKIMAPIVNKNFEVAEKLSKTCAVRHIPLNYTETAIIDGKHFFQFKSPQSEQAKHELVPRLENSLYTDDFDYVKKLKRMLNTMWNNAHAPSAMSLESIIDLSPKPDIKTVPADILPHLKKMPGGVAGRMEVEKITEKEIVNKILTARKAPVVPSKDVSKAYGSIAGAVIHPPDDFNLPDNIVIHIYHMEKQSGLGEEDAIVIYLLRETPIGQAYVPVAMVGNNPNAHIFWKSQLAGSPAEHNVQLVNKDELQIRIHGNTLFAGWTVTIPLLPPQYVFPPACLLIEGYGDVKTVTYTTPIPSGYTTFWETNVFGAFVTFFHPSSKYSGPGTEGFFARDFVSTTYPPSAQKETHQDS
jgi:sugar-specific transcriptional regulator TrmB